MAIRELTPTEQAELNALNDAVDAAIETRRTWLDRKMVECSDLQPGDAIYDLNKGTLLGQISKLYRFWRDREEGVMDRSLSCDYEYETHPRCFDNTSRQVGASFGTREQAQTRLQSRADFLAR